MAVAKKNFNNPDETRTPPKTKLEIVEVEGNTIARTTFEPGWRWSEHIKPIAGTDSCQVHHVIVQQSGRLGVRLNDGTEFECEPDDVYDIPPGHDAWVIGDDAFVGIDISGDRTYAK
jgi:hypothetical protein